MTIVAERNAGRSVAPELTKRAVTIKVDPIVPRKGTAAVEPIRHPLLGPPTLDPVGALGLPDTLTLDPVRTFGPLYALTLDPVGAFGALNALTFDPIRTLRTLYALALDAL